MPTFFKSTTFYLSAWFFRCICNRSKARCCVSKDDDSPIRILNYMVEFLPECILRVSIIKRWIVNHYYWEGTDTNGVQHESAPDSETLSAAKENLLSNGFFSLRFWKIVRSRLHKVLSNNEVTEFLLQLHRLLKSGVELDDALGFTVHEQKIVFWVSCFAEWVKIYGTDFH